MAMTYQWRSRRTTAWNHIHPMMPPLQTWLTLLPTMVLMQLPLDFGKTRNLMTLTLLLTTIRSTLKQLLATLWTIPYPGGSVDDPGGGVIDDKGSFCDPSTSTLTSPKTSASFVTSSLTNRVSLLSLSDKSTVDMVGITDYATGSFCSSCSIEPSMPGGLWLDGIGCAMCSYDNGG